MTTLRLHIFRIALLLVTALAFTGCRDDARDDGQEPDPEWYGTSLQVTINVKGDGRTGGTRAAGDNPTGGNDGDGHEVGNTNENVVNNVTLLLYQDADGINSTANPTIRYAFYAPVMHADKSNVYTSDVLHYKTTLAGGGYHVIVLANAGDYTYLEGKTLAEVRDLQLKQTYKQTYDANGMPKDAGTAGHFVMTSSDDVMLNVNGAGGPNYINRLTAEVERLAARIDFSPGQLNTGAGAVPDLTHAVWTEGEDVTAEIEGVSTTKKLTGYKYVVRTVTDGTPIATNDRFILTGVTPFNCLKSGTYCIKRVMNTLGSGAKELKYLGDEQTDADGNGINYVVDPWTDQKSLDTPISGIGYRNPLTSPEELLPEANRWPVKAPSALAPVDVNPKGLEYYILDYTQENTLPPGHGKEHYATGLQFSGYYGHWDEVTHTYTYKPQNYHYYIRHADPNNSSNEGLPMKYGIVRNNIYRIHVGSVNSLGQIEIVVSEWNRIDVPGIQL